MPNEDTYHKDKNNKMPYYMPAYYQLETNLSTSLIQAIRE